MITAVKDYSTAWVCVDCYYEHHNIGDDLNYETPPLHLISDNAEVTAGLMAEEHETGCTVFTLDGDYTGDECECERITFSWSPCDGCGSRLGGSREALTIWH